MPPLSRRLDAIVEQSWQAALDANPTLFNGRIFSADLLTPDLIRGHWSEYRRAVAQMNRPELAGQLGLRPLAVCGVLLCRHQGEPAVLFGKRSHHTSYQQGLWQLPPAGSVDAKAAGPAGSVDIRGALLTELHEEVGLAADCARAILPLCAIEHPGTRVLDLGMAIETDLAAETVLAAHAASGDREYSDMRIVRLDQALAFATADDVVPSARWLLERVIRL